MNAPLNSDPQLYALEDGRPAAPSSYAPSVPISVYRELATELKTTQTTLDALTQQNQQLLRQNKLLRTEIQRFVQSATQLGHFAGVLPQETPTPPPEESTAAPLPEIPAPPEWFQSAASESASTAPPETSVTAFEPPAASSPLSPTRPTDRPPQSREKIGKAQVNSAIVPHPKGKKRDRPSLDSSKYRLFTEQPDEGRPLSKVAARSELSNLWLTTTILLVVVSAFGAGFLIMRPLLRR
ncbi:MAG: hypothetical protein AAF892_17150 [Cyanobacteria bacterium P01_D01_bin.71]